MQTKSQWAQIVASWSAIYENVHAAASRALPITVRSTDPTDNLPGPDRNFQASNFGRIESGLFTWAGMPAKVWSKQISSKSLQSPQVLDTSIQLIHMDWGKIYACLKLYRLRWILEYYVYRWGIVWLL